MATKSTKQKRHDLSHLRSPEVRAKAVATIKRNRELKKAQEQGTEIPIDALRALKFPAKRTPIRKAKGSPANTELALELLRVINKLIGG